MVKNLINGETNTWKVVLLIDMFDQESIMAITKIILSIIPRHDRLTWVADPKCLFSVKSAMGLIQRDVWPAAPNPIWHKFWKNKIHERLKTFVWRIGRDILPTNLNILSRMSIGDLRCPLCNSELESVSHVFFQCQATKMFWFGTCWGIRAELFVVNMDVDVVKLVMDPPIPLSDPGVMQMNKNLASVQIALTLEAIWRFHNQHVHHSKIENPNVSIKVLEFKVVEHMQKLWAENSLFTPNDLKWLPPPHGIVKLNVDAAIFYSSACIAVITRNESGLFIKA